MRQVKLLSVFFPTQTGCAAKNLHKKLQNGFFCSSADACVASYQQLNPLAHTLKGFMVLLLCLEAATGSSFQVLHEIGR